MSKTLYDKLWDAHIVSSYPDDRNLIYIDRHLLHEVTSPQAFAGLQLTNRPVWRKISNLAVEDHIVPTKKGEQINDPISKLSLKTLAKNCQDFEIQRFGREDPRQGIVHIMGPEQGACLPGMTIVCGDSHTSTNGALGALAFGIGTTEVEHVLATQCLPLRKAKNMRIHVNGKIPDYVSAKDIILTIIGRIGTAGGTGYSIEFSGDTITELTMEGRMTVCNMSIEAGARSGLIAVDTTTVDYVEGRPFSPTGQLWGQAVDAWQDLHSDPDACFDKEFYFDANTISPQVSWGTSPEMVVPIHGEVPDPNTEMNPSKRQGLQHALDYMALTPGTLITNIKLDKIFIGSCTNSRIEDLRAAANFIKGKKIAKNIKLAMIVPGSGLVKQQAESEGLAKIFTTAGFEWREPGCSMCLAMNTDRLSSGERCASTSNRNFEGRQGYGGRTHLVSPIVAAAASIAGHFVDPRE